MEHYLGEKLKKLREDRKWSRWFGEETWKSGFNDKWLWEWRTYHSTWCVHQCSIFIWYFVGRICWGRKDTTDANDGAEWATTRHPSQFAKRIFVSNRAWWRTNANSTRYNTKFQRVNWLLLSNTPEKWIGRGLLYRWVRCYNMKGYQGLAEQQKGRSSLPWRSK